MSLDELSSFSLCIAGGLGGITAWAATYPADVVKSRIQVDGMIREQVGVSNVCHFTLLGLFPGDPPPIPHRRKK